MSCLFPAYVASDKQQEKDLDIFTVKQEFSAKVEKDDTPVWLENASFKTDDALLLHQRHLDQVQKSKKNINHELKLDGEQDKDKDKDKKKTVKRSESPDVKKQKRSHSPESTSRDVHGKKSRRRSLDNSNSKDNKVKHRRHSSESSYDDNRHELKNDRKRKLKKDHKKSEHKSKHKHKHKHKHRDEKREKERTEDKVSGNKISSAKNVTVIPPGKVFIDELDITPENAFRVDRKPDKNNVEYESIYKMNVAKFRSSKHCLGQTSGMSIFSKNSKGTKPYQLPDRYFSKNKLKLVYDDENVLDLNVGKYVKNAEKFSVLQCDSTDFLQFTEVKSEKSEYNPLGIYDQKTTMYIQGVGGISSKQSESAEDACPKVNFKETLSENMKRQTEEFSRSLRENPNDVKMWLEFVKFQDNLLESEMAAERESGAKSNKGKKRMFLLEKKQTVIDKALEKNPNNVQLQLKKLELCSNVWNSEMLTTEWEKLVLGNVGNAELWREYLLFVQSSFSTFSVSKAIKQYMRCIRTFRDLKSRKQKYQFVTVPKDVDLQILGFFIQFCDFLKQAGYAEKAIALFQAMIEFNHFLPSALLKVSHDEQVALFEPFWDCCVPRFGDEGAVGWSYWIQDKSIVFPPPLVSAVDEAGEDVLDKSLPKNKNWLAVEKHRDQMFWLPWRPDITKGQGQEDCEDPDRLVLIDDITDFLVSLSGDAKEQLVLSFLEFLDLPNHSSKISGKTVVRSHTLHHELPRHCFCSKSSESLDFYGALSSFPSYDNSILQRFATELFKQTIKLVPLDMQQGISISWVNFEINRLEINKGADKKERKQLYKEVKKFCKSVLQEESNRDSLELWELYGRFEWRYGNIADARKVFDMAIGMHCKDVLKLDKEKQIHAVKVCFSYCELVLGFHEPNMVLSKKMGLSDQQMTHVIYILICLVGAADFTVPSSETASTPPQMLKARKCFLDILKVTSDNFLSAYQRNVDFGDVVELTVAWTKCVALFQYLSHGIKAAAVVMEETVDKIKPFTMTRLTPSAQSTVSRNLDISAYLEQLQVFYARLLTFHLTTTYAPLSILRHPLMRSLQMFPDNPSLLAMFIEVEASSHIAGRVRKYFNHATNSGTVTTWLFAIQAELLRKQALVESFTSGDQGLAAIFAQKPPDMGISNRIRYLFERATSTHGGKHCVLLWRMFVHFEVSEGNLSKAKAVFYRALQHCPWAKSLYMDGVNYFNEEYQEVTDLMTEKEIRVRCLPEELDILLEDEEDMNHKTVEDSEVVRDDEECLA